MSFQHYVTGSGDDSFALLSSMYGVSASEIGRESGYTWNSDAIYGWLSSHGGTEQTPGVWSFSPGMVLNIPGSGPSRSPVVSGAVPGGPGVVIVLGPGNDTPVVEPTNGDGDTVVGPAQAAVGGGFTNILMAGIAIGAVLYLFSGDKKKGKGKTRAKRKTRVSRKTRRTSRRKSRR